MSDKILLDLLDRQTDEHIFGIFYIAYLQTHRQPQIINKLIHNEIVNK